MTMATRVDILKNYFAHGQYNIFRFSTNSVTSEFKHNKAASVTLVYSTR